MNDNIVSMHEALLQRMLRELSPQYRVGAEAGLRIGDLHGNAIDELLMEFASSEDAVAFTAEYLTIILYCLGQSASNVETFRASVGIATDRAAAMLVDYYAELDANTR